MEHLNKLYHKHKGILIILLVILGFQACYYDNEEELYPFESQNCDTLTPLNYNERIAPIIQNNCAISGCHTGINPTGGLYLDTYLQVKAIADNGDLANRALINKDMPPSGPLSFCEQEAIQAWINAGAPQN